MGFQLLSATQTDLARSGDCSRPLRASISGEMNIYTVATLKAAMEQALAQGPRLEIDLAAVDALDTAGLQLMLMSKRIPEKTVTYFGHSPVVLDMLELANLAHAIGDPLLLTSRDCASA